MGRRLHCFSPNWNLRLFRRGLGRIEDLGLADLEGTGDNEIHEHVEVNGKLGFLRTPLLHNDDRGLTAWLDRHNRYATWEAHLYRRSGASRSASGRLASYVSTRSGESGCSGVCGYGCRFARLCGSSCGMWFGGAFSTAALASLSAS